MTDLKIVLLSLALMRKQSKWGKFFTQTFCSFLSSIKVTTIEERIRIQAPFSKYLNNFQKGQFANIVQEGSKLAPGLNFVCQIAVKIMFYDRVNINT